MIRMHGGPPCRIDRGWPSSRPGQRKPGRGRERSASHLRDRGLTAGAAARRRLQGRAEDPIEDFEKGAAYNVIGKRRDYRQPDGGVPGVRRRRSRLTWYWERFAYPGSQFYKMALELNTDTDRRFGLSWHGSDEAEQLASTSTLMRWVRRSRRDYEAGDETSGRPSPSRPTDQRLAWTTRS